jgi:hypothetical protein
VDHRLGGGAYGDFPVESAVNCPPMARLARKDANLLYRASLRVSRMAMTHADSTEIYV